MPEEKSRQDRVKEAMKAWEAGKTKDEKFAPGSQLLGALADVNNDGKVTPPEMDKMIKDIQKVGRADKNRDGKLSPAESKAAGIKEGDLASAPKPLLDAREILLKRVPGEQKNLTEVSADQIQRVMQDAGVRMVDNDGRELPALPPAPAGKGGR